MRFSVYDQDISSNNDHIGRSDVLLSQLVEESPEFELELKLIPTAKKGETPGDGCAGFLKIRVECSTIEMVRSRAVRDLFGRFDRDGNGRLDASEFLQLQSCLSADGQRSSVFSRADSNQDGFVDIGELFKCVEDLIPDDVVADYYVKSTVAPLLLHGSGQVGAALTEEQAGRGWLVAVTEWISRDKYVAQRRHSVAVCVFAFYIAFVTAGMALGCMWGEKQTILWYTIDQRGCLKRKQLTLHSPFR